MKRRAGLVAALALGGCAGAQSPLAPTGDQAAALHALFWLMMVVCGVMYALVLLGLGAAVLRRRPAAAGGEDADVPLGRALWLWGALIVGGLTLLIVGSFLADRAMAAAEAHEALVVRVTGHQWWWRIRYRDPAGGGWIETANELHLPAGRTARIELGSADVIHSFWVPNVAGKMDVIPGHANAIDVTPRRLGWFRGQCAEYCGVQHAHMAFDVAVDAPDAFDRWLAAQARPAPATPAAALFAAGPCAACHAVRGTGARGRAGPDLTHVASRRTLAAGTLPMGRGPLQGWIAAPQALKPGTTMPQVGLTPAEADATATYLIGLR